MADNLTTDDLAGRTTSGEDIAEDAPLARDDRGADGVDARREPLLDEGQASSFTERWREVQVDFVDRPRESVEQADALVAELMQKLAASFSDERSRLEQQWEGGDEVSTEDLRVALTRYRSFFDRLLSA